MAQSQPPIADVVVKDRFFQDDLEWDFSRLSDGYELATTWQFESHSWPLQFLEGTDSKAFDIAFFDGWGPGIGLSPHAQSVAAFQSTPQETTGLPTLETTALRLGAFSERWSLDLQSDRDPVAFDRPLLFSELLTPQVIEARLSFADAAIDHVTRPIGDEGASKSNAPKAATNPFGLTSENFSGFVLSGESWDASPAAPAGGPTVVTWSLVPDNTAFVPGLGIPVNSQSLDSFLYGGFINEVYAAFDAWEAVANIKFVQVADGGGDIGAEVVADIRLTAIFDEVDGFLAAAAFPDGSPEGGDVIFDSAEGGFWTPHNFFLVATHEIGHAIGLDHTNVPGALMEGFFNADLDGPEADDIAGIQAIYGAANPNQPWVYDMPTGVINIEIIDTAGFGMELTVRGNAIPNSIFGSEFAETLLGLGDGDTLEGRGGNDTIEGGDGNDFIRGGAGNDIIDGGAGNDTANYAPAPGGVTLNLQVGRADNDGYGSMDLLSGIEIVNGSAFADNLTGDNGDNIFTGDGGNDILNGGGGSDLLIGGDDNDIFVMVLSDGDDSITGGNGFDILDYSGVNSVVQINQLAGTTTGSAGNDVLNDVIEQISGSNFDDVLSGGHGINVLDGNGGNDLFFGNNGDDLMRGGDGNDTFFFSTNDGDDRLLGGNGFDILDYSTLPGVVQVNQLAGTTTGTANNDILLDVFEQVVGSSFDDVLSGGHGINSLNGGGGDDQIFANGGNDWTTGGTGTDTITLGPGDDRFQFWDGDGADTVTDFVAGAGTDDQLVLSTVSAATSLAQMLGDGMISQAGPDTIINFGGGDTITLAGVTMTDLHSDDFTF